MTLYWLFSCAYSVYILFWPPLAVTRIDYLQVDTEGSDADILRGIDFSLWRPRVIQYEHSWLTAQDVLETLTLLHNVGYGCKLSSMSVHLIHLCCSLRNSHCPSNIDDFVSVLFQDTFCIEMVSPKEPESGATFSAMVLVNGNPVQFSKPENIPFSVAILGFCCQHILLIDDCEHFSHHLQAQRETVI
jgi:hypothetical protein